MHVTKGQEHEMGRRTKPGVQEIAKKKINEALLIYTSKTVLTEMNPETTFNYNIHVHVFRRII